MQRRGQYHTWTCCVAGFQSRLCPNGVIRAIPAVPPCLVRPKSGHSVFTVESGEPKFYGLFGSALAADEVARKIVGAKSTRKIDAHSSCQPRGDRRTTSVSHSVRRIGGRKCISP